MVSAVEQMRSGRQLYRVRYRQYDQEAKVPFRVAPKPFAVTRGEKGEIEAIGQDVSSFFAAVVELYKNDGKVRSLLDRGKPQIFCTDAVPDYLFVRPDLIITSSGFAICELETSPFGLALAEIFNRAYRMEGYETLVDDGTLTEYVRNQTPNNGSIVYSNKTEAFHGQMEFLASEVFSGDQRLWDAHMVFSTGERDPKAVYRAFYLNEYQDDMFINAFIDDAVARKLPVMPSLTPQMEEKALLALLWDRRWESYFVSSLGQGTFNHLRSVVPPSWIIGEEAYFALGLPGGITDSIELARLSGSKRAFVLKQSGFHTASSWGEGVHFLQKMAHAKAEHILHNASRDKDHVAVIQEFRKPADMVIPYEEQEGI